MCSGYTDHAWNTFLDSQQVDQIDQEESIIKEKGEHERGKKVKGRTPATNKRSYFKLESMPGPEARGKLYDDDHVSHTDKQAKRDLLANRKILKPQKTEP